MVGVFWVPYADDAHPFHSQVMHWDMSPLKLEGEASDDGQVVGIGALFNKADIRYEDCVTFSDSDVDAYGMPRMSISYGLTERDHDHTAEIRRQQDRAAAAFGSFAAGRGPRVMPPGSSLHYQGTMRMAESDDGESVCDPYARVWGFRNLYVGGNGVIPTATCGNSTLTSVAIAVRSARALAAAL
jgi:pyranose oxidase